MTTNKSLKKPVIQEDWHPSDIKAALEKLGWSLRQLGFEHGYSGNNSFSEAFRKPWPKVERIIADTLGLKPEAIWPTRYDSHGLPNRVMGRRPKRPDHLPVKPSTSQTSGNTQTKKVA